MAKEICEDCGRVFEAGPSAFICPTCRKRRLSESAKKRNLSKLGLAALNARNDKPTALPSREGSGTIRD